MSRFADFEDDEPTLVEVLDRLLDRGVVLRGDLIITVADIELVWVGLKVVLGSVDTVKQLHPGIRREQVEAQARLEGTL